ncbi:MAG TPA: ABC transporter permease [Gemmatimonadaceae bacterium]|nr:ABC transporter permease [Gemmatimonadaceae bacterium]
MGSIAVRSAPSPTRTRLLSTLRQQGALIALLAACAFGFARYGAFLTPENIVNIVRQNSMVGLVALGMTFVILTGGIDLSVGAILAVAGIVLCYMAPYGTAVAVATAIGAAALIGLANGLLIAKARIQPFITTLAMMIAARGFALAVTGENSIPLPAGAQNIAWIGRGEIGPVPVPVILIAVAFLGAWIVLGYTRFGRSVYAVGDSPDAAKLLGLDVDRVLIATYVVSAAFAGLAGVVLASRLGAAQPVAGTGWELDAIAAVVVGGTVLTGGRGGAGLTLIGVLLLGVILNLLNLEGTVSPWWQWVIRGAFLLAVVVVQGRMQRKAAAA